jgi:hypothetical protein
MSAPAERQIRFDADLSDRDIQALSSADAVTAFFARLGYDTSARTVQTPGNLGIATEGTLAPIRRIELIADREALFQVYLFELKSVTVSHTRALARAFRNRAGNFLLVLTSDYERLDFVVLERFLPPAAPGSSIGERQVGIRPRALTVERRHAGRRALRVLKRLTWTEPDGFAQHDKLLAAYSVADWAEEHFNNRALFSDYYLLERLREFPEWLEDPKPAYASLRKLYLDTFERFARKPLAELKKGLVEPVLAVLGFEPRPGKGGAAHETPDYQLHGPGGGVPLASLIAYPWARSLDGKDSERDSATPDENPGAIVVSLLEKSDAPWAVVTNGRIWRLYARQTHSRATNYYELDAEELLADTGAPVADPGEAFRYFWLLFRRAAFQKHPAQREGKTQELSLLDRLLLESEDYARDLGSRLKDHVFEKVFPHLAHGFVEHLRDEAGTRAVPQEELDAIYQGTLTLLYRLLFLLYAEARDLFPVREVRGYWEASLARIKKEIAEHAGEISDEVPARVKKAYRDDAYSLWDGLKRLFRVVDRGDAALNVPFYNGGLFLTEPEADDDTPEAVAARFLAAHKVSDRDLARALDLLSRTVDDKRHSLVFIDYKSLGVRQLGSIYEGLLEFRLRIAGEKLAIAREKGREIYVSFSELDERARERAERSERVVRKGSVYLENDKRERKASGSYYTPDYIVEYIVEHAVGPVLDEKFEKMRPKIRKAQAERKAFDKRQEELAARGIGREPAETAERIGENLVDELFDIKVLDPAMGSGHFLVEAVDFITDRMLTFLNAFPWNPVQAYLARMRDTILLETESQGVTLDPAKLTDVNLLKRHVLKRCIYGVDLNPMAVELAKVSLWLDCFTLGAPLSFLDHHLRCGNSLIGITEKQFEESQQRWGQMDLLGGSQYAGAKMAVGAMIEVGRLADITPSQIKDSRRHYSMAAEALAPIKRLFDVYASQWFGNEPRKERRGKHSAELNPALDFLRDPLCAEWSQHLARKPVPEHFQEVVHNAVEASRRYRLFHWELEFPEVFFGIRTGTSQTIERLDGAGFDSVIGNPPYDVLAEEELGYDISQELAFFEAQPVYAPAIRGKKNLYKLFICRGRQVTSASGVQSFIVPMAVLGDDQAAGVRRLLLTDSKLLAVEAFPQKDDAGNRVFPEAKLSTAVFVAKVIDGNDEDGFSVRTHPGRFIEETTPALCMTLRQIREFDKANLPILTCTARDWVIAQKILELRPIRRLEMYATSFQGEVNETIERQRGTLSARSDAPLALRGANISLYAVREASQGEEIRVATKRFLGGKEIGGKAFAYLKRRVGFQRSAPQNNFRRLIAAPIPAGLFCLDTVSFVGENTAKVPLELLLALLNSQLLDWYFRLSSTNSKINEYQFNELPVPDVGDPAALERRVRRDRDGKVVLADFTQVMPKRRAPGQLTFDDLVAITKAVERIVHLESNRSLGSRKERAMLGDASKRYQQEIDRILFAAYGLTEDESAYVSHRLTEML